jgi:putative ABC transport system permease protein
MIWNAFAIAVREIGRNLTRAFLTVLGVFIGVAAIITMVTLGQGATLAVKAQISNLGSNLLALRPGAGFGSPGGGRAEFHREGRGNHRRADRRHRRARARPRRFAEHDLPAQRPHLRRHRHHAGLFPDQQVDLADGRFFTDADLRSGGAVCVIGNTVRQELFGGDNPVGAKIRIGKASCEVIGLLKTKGQAGMGDQDDTIIVPLSTLQRRLIGKTSSHDISQIAISAQDGPTATPSSPTSLRSCASAAISRSNQDNNFSVFDTRQIAEALGSTTQLMTMLLARWPACRCWSAASAS